MPLGARSALPGVRLSHREAIGPLFALAMAESLGRPLLGDTGRAPDARGAEPLHGHLLALDRDNAAGRTLRLHRMDRLQDLDEAFVQAQSRQLAPDVDAVLQPL